MQILRLNPDHAPLIKACFERVYGTSYANELFYDEKLIAQQMASGRLQSVGALAEDGSLLGHMAMQSQANALFAELGNTIIDPRARGAGLAWRVGEALTQWCSELGHTAYLHYPTTDHHIMQRRSVTSGFETGLMLGYIPAETDAKVNRSKPALRGAATVVVNPLAPCLELSIFCPADLASLINSFSHASKVPRKLTTSITHAAPHSTSFTAQRYVKRELNRLRISTVGKDLPQVLKAWLHDHTACNHIDFCMDDPNINVGVEQARDAGFIFCAWLPGYIQTDVLRLQKVDAATTNLAPGVVNAVGQQLLTRCLSELG